MLCYRILHQWSYWYHMNNMIKFYTVLGTTQRKYITTSITIWFFVFFHFHKENYKINIIPLTTITVAGLDRTSVYLCVLITRECFYTCWACCTTCQACFHTCWACCTTCQACFHTCWACCTTCQACFHTCWACCTTCQACFHTCWACCTTCRACFHTCRACCTTCWSWLKTCREMLPHAGTRVYNCELRSSITHNACYIWEIEPTTRKKACFRGKLR